MNNQLSDTGMHRIQTAYDRRTQQIATEFKRRLTDRQPMPSDLSFDDLANYLPEVRRG
jgi:hypothetical protein